MDKGQCITMVCYLQAGEVNQIRIQPAYGPRARLTPGLFGSAGDWALAPRTQPRSMNLTDLLVGHVPPDLVEVYPDAPFCKGCGELARAGVVELLTDAVESAHVGVVALVL